MLTGTAPHLPSTGGEFLERGRNDFGPVALCRQRRNVGELAGLGVVHRIVAEDLGGGRRIARRDHRFQGGHRGAAAAAGDRHVFPGVALLGERLLMTFSAAASPPDVHQCSIWTSLLSAAEAPDARPSAPAVITPAIRIERSFMVTLPVRFLRRKRSGCRIRKAVSAPDCLGSRSAREPPTCPRSGMDVECLFLGVVLDGVAPEFATNAIWRRSKSSIHLTGVYGNARGRSCLSVLSAAEAWRAFGSKGRDALGQILCVSGEGAGEPLDRRVPVLAFSRVDHRLDHLDGQRATLGDIGRKRACARQAPRPSRRPHRRGQAAEPSSAGNIAPVRAMRRTTEAPKRRTSLCVPDQPGAMPRPDSGSPSLIPLSAIRMSPTAASSRPPPKAWPVRTTISGHTKTCERFEGSVACARPVAPHLERRQAAPGCDVATRAKGFALAREDRDAGFGRGLDCARAVKEGIDHWAIECIEFVRALQRQARARTLKAQIDEGAHWSVSRAGRSCRLRGSGRNSAGSILRQSFAMRSGNSAWARMSRSRSIPGAISVTVTPSGSRRITQRSVT